MCLISNAPGTHLGLSQALGSAEHEGLRLAVSNPAFEFWYLLHFLYTDREFFGCSRCDCVTAKAPPRVFQDHMPLPMTF